ncbi:MAG: tRNA uracil 4-sulfurtransferase ThiI [Myxococcota bacterium]
MGTAASPHLALLRFSGELGTKARPTRLRFRRRLVENLKDALASSGIEARVEVSHERLFVELPEPLDPTDHPLLRVFGIQSVSFVERHDCADLDAVVATGQRLFADAVRGRRFAVRARRVGERRAIPIDPREVERALGTALLPASAGVDLSHPETTAHVELSERGASFFADRLPGPGGLPLGVEGRAVALMSGGFDSPVAAWQLQRRGVALDYVFCNMGGNSHLQGVARVAKALADRWCYGQRPRFHAVDFEPIVGALQKHTATRYWQVLLKRLMLRTAEAVARQRRAAAIVTGDAVGQVSSQTLQNLAVVSRATDLPILRPLVGSNKEEIIDQARRIGTFEVSKVVGEYCDMVPSKPATRAALAAIETEEAKLPSGLVESAVETRSVFDLRALDLGSLDLPGLAVDRPPEGATIIDLRPLDQYRSEHHPEALHLEFGQAAETWPNFDRGGTYLLCCEFGLMSAHLAERMRADGFRVFHLRGGQRALMRLAREG